MKQSFTYGSVRGTPGNRRSYRDTDFDARTEIGAFFCRYREVILPLTVRDR